MQDHIGLSPAVHAHLGWGMPVTTKAQHDKSPRYEFDKAWRKWAYYQADPNGYFAAMKATESDGGSSEDDMFGTPQTNGHVSGFGKAAKPRASSLLSGNGLEWEPDLPPTERLSRTLRVLVAWKSKPKS